MHSFGKVSIAIGSEVLEDVVLVAMKVESVLNDAVLVGKAVASGVVVAVAAVVLVASDVAS